MGLTDANWNEAESDGRRGMMREAVTWTETFTSGTTRMAPIDVRRFACIAVDWSGTSFAGRNIAILGSHTSNTSDLKAMSDKNTTAAYTQVASTGWQLLNVDTVFPLSYMSLGTTAAPTTALTIRLMGKT